MESSSLSIDAIDEIDRAVDPSILSIASLSDQMNPDRFWGGPKGQAQIRPHPIENGQFVASPSGTPPKAIRVHLVARGDSSRAGFLPRATK